MQTQTEVNRSDAQARSRRLNYERALAERDNARRRLATEEPRIAKAGQQLALLDRLDTLACDLDGTVQGPGSFLCRDQIIRQLAACRETQQRRLDDATVNLKKLQADLPKFDAAVKAYES